MLWASLHFPQLPIDRLSEPSSDTPIVVIQQSGAQKTIMSCNTAAKKRGIHKRLTLKSAYAIAPDLLVNDYNETEQSEHIRQLTLWALHYSSWVTPRPPTTVVLEIAGSLTLFGGLTPLIQRILKAAEAQHLTMRIGVAPTPAAATLLAESGATRPVLDSHSLSEALSDIAVEYLPLDAFTFHGLRQSGIRTLGQLRSMEPAALTRRFGHTLTDYLFKLDGTLPDPCTAFKAPERFTESLDLPLETQDTGALAFPLNRLLHALCGYLKAGDHGIKEMTLEMFHHKHPTTSVILKFLDATANHSHLLKVANEKLSNTQLPEPVIRLRLSAEGFADVARAGKDLFRKSQAHASSIEQVFDTLSARLGKEALYTAVPGDDHRPEKAWLSALFGSHEPPGDWPARPLWLLRQPEVVSEPLTLASAAERIENGWWDNPDVRRDYFIAHNRQGTHYWVFRLRQKPSQLYIHGIFA
ncbi:MAG: DNA polymerase Y family protein [Gammaproteobacteria bacterium]|nr:DNA polymerase Y family protein [Gammaproteobacteria bacterium]